VDKQIAKPITEERFRRSICQLRLCCIKTGIKEQSTLHNNVGSRLLDIELLSLMPHAAIAQQ